MSIGFSNANKKYTGYSGIGKLRRTLRRLEPESTEKLREVMADGATAIEETMLYLGREHVRTGEMLQMIEQQKGRDGLTYLIGPGAKSIRVSKNPFDTTQYKQGIASRRAMQFFKAYWIEFGTKGDPSRNIPPQPATPFVNPAYDVHKNQIARDAKAEVSKILKGLASG